MSLENSNFLNVLEPKEGKEHLTGFDLLVFAIFFVQIQL